MIRSTQLMTRTLKPLALTSLTVLLTACGAFGPERNPPAMAQPAHYAIASQPAAFDADGTAQTLDVGAAPVPQWWTAYHCPELNALVEEGLNNSPSLKSAQRTLQAARDGLRSQIGESLFPSVDVGFAPARQRGLGLPGLSQETFLYNVFEAQVQASYTFDFFGASVLADRALAEQVDQQAFQFAATRRGLATNIVVATINVSALQEQLNYTTQMVALGEERAQQMKDRYELGSAAHDDALAAEQDAANTAATLPPLRMQLLAARHAQAVLLGRAPDQAPPVLPLEKFTLPHNVPVAIPSDLIHQRPDILAAEAAVRATADEAGAATASMFPELTLSANYGRGGFDWTTFSSPAGLIWGIGARLTQPIFHGGALVARKHQYENAHEAAVAEYQQTVLSAFQSVANTLVSLEEDANTLKQTVRAETATADMASDTQARYRLGATPYYATLTAGQQMYLARIQSSRARAARLNDTAALFDAMGDPPVKMEPHGLFGIRMPEPYVASGVTVAK